MASENVIAEAVVRIAASSANGRASFHKLKKEIPKLITLGAGDLAPSTTRNGEPMWHQKLRNIKSHSDQEGNYIFEGYLRHVPRVGFEVTRTGKAKFGL